MTSSPADVQRLADLHDSQDYLLPAANQEELRILVETSPVPVYAQSLSLLLTDIDLDVDEKDFRNSTTDPYHLELLRVLPDYLPSELMTIVIEFLSAFIITASPTLHPSIRFNIYRLFSNFYYVEHHDSFAPVKDGLYRKLLTAERYSFLFDASSFEYQPRADYNNMTVVQNWLLRKASFAEIFLNYIRNISSFLHELTSFDRSLHDLPQLQTPIAASLYLQICYKDLPNPAFVLFDDAEPTFLGDPDSICAITPQFSTIYPLLYTSLLTSTVEIPLLLVNTSSSSGYYDFLPDATLSTPSLHNIKNAFIKLLTTTTPPTSSVYASCLLAFFPIDDAAMLSLSIGCLPSYIVSILPTHAEILAFRSFFERNLILLPHYYRCSRTEVTKSHLKCYLCFIRTIRFWPAYLFPTISYPIDLPDYVVSSTEPYLSPDVFNLNPIGQELIFQLQMHPYFLSQHDLPSPTYVQHPSFHPALKLIKFQSQLLQFVGKLE